MCSQAFRKAFRRQLRTTCPCASTCCMRTSSPVSTSMWTGSTSSRRSSGAKLAMWPACAPRLSRRPSGGSCALRVHARVPRVAQCLQVCELVLHPQDDLQERSWRCGRRVLPGFQEGLQEAAAHYVSMREYWLHAHEWPSVYKYVDWFYLLKAIFRSRAGGVAGVCSQAFMKAFRRQLRTTYPCASTCCMRTSSPVSTSMWTGPTSSRRSSGAKLAVWPACAPRLSEAFRMQLRTTCACASTC